MQGTGGAVIPFERGGAPAVREEYVEAIQLWCKTRDTAEILSREEIGAMRAFDRIDAQRKAIIIHLAHYYQKHDRADVAPGLAVILTLLSDNEDGSAKISQEILAQLFGRSRTAIYQAQSRLKEAGIIITGRGRHARTYPVIPRVVTQSYNHLAWTVNAIAQDSVNCKGPASNSQLLSQPEQLKQLPSPPEQLADVNCQVEPVSIAKADLTPIHYKSSTTLKAASVVATGIATALSALPAAAHPSEPPAIVEPAKLSLQQMTDRMADVAGSALVNPAGAMGLLTFSELQRWLADGCDFETDILQTIRAVASRQPNASISTWKYFTRAIAAAKAARTAPMPEVHVPQARAPDWRDDERERRKQLKAALEKYRG
jgi:biotin operon repressor